MSSSTGFVGYGCFRTLFSNTPTHRAHAYSPGSARMRAARQPASQGSRERGPDNMKGQTRSTVPRLGEHTENPAPQCTINLH